MILEESIVYSAYNGNGGWKNTEIRFAEGIKGSMGQSFCIYELGDFETIVHQIDEKYIPSVGGGSVFNAEFTAMAGSFELVDCTNAEILDACKYGDEVVIKVHNIWGGSEDYERYYLSTYNITNNFAVFSANTMAPSNTESRSVSFIHVTEEEITRFSDDVSS